MPTVYNVSQAAAVVGVSPSSLRNWCKQYAAFLSASASPAPGNERILTQLDVATLQHIKAQRDALKDYETIIAELAAMPIEATATPYIDATTTLQPPATPTDAPQGATVALQPTDILQALQSTVEGRYNQLQGQIDALERRQGDNLQWFMFGIVAGVLLVGVVASIVLVGAWWR